MRILLIRDYERADHCQYFYEAARECDLSLLYFKYPQQKTPKLPYPIHYWSEFSTPAELLRTLRPDKIVFSDVEAFDEVALNVAARKAGVETFVLEHGLRYSEEVHARYGTRGTAAIGHRDWTKERVAQRLHTLLFYLSVLPRCTPRERLTLLRFLHRRSVDDMTVALHKFQFELRFPDWYINYSHSNVGYLMERDGLHLSRFKLIGNPALDELFVNPAEAPPHVPREPFYLLIDSPLVEVDSIAISGEEKRAFLLKLNAFARSRNAKLYVKLHPYSYVYDHSVSYLPQDDNIIYGRAVSLGPLLGRAEGCFGILSTLMTVVPCINRCILFHLPDQPFTHELVDRGVAGGLPFHDFMPEDIAFDAVRPDDASLKSFVEYYLFKADGKSTERLREILLSRN